VRKVAADRGVARLDFRSQGGENLGGSEIAGGVGGAESGESERGGVHGGEVFRRQFSVFSDQHTKGSLDDLG
jgi:hypothetical protein